MVHNICIMHYMRHMHYMHVILVLIRVYHTTGIKYRGFMLSIRSHVRRVIVRRMPATLIVAWLVNCISNILDIRYLNGSNFVTRMLCFSLDSLFEHFGQYGASTCSLCGVL